MINSFQTLTYRQKTIVEQRGGLTRWPDYHHHRHRSDSCTAGLSHSGSQTWGQCLLHPGLRWARCGWCGCWGGWSFGRAWCGRCTGMRPWRWVSIRHLWRRVRLRPAGGGWTDRDATREERSGWRGWRCCGHWCRHCHSTHCCPGNWDRERYTAILFAI